MPKLVQIGAILGVLLTAWTLTTGVREAWKNQAELERQHIRADLQHERDDERRDERLRVLEHVIVGEWPQYTLSVFPPKE